jgi:hypothetical protein
VREPPPLLVDGLRATADPVLPDFLLLFAVAFLAIIISRYS